jgi:hypothetical protein
MNRSITQEEDMKPQVAHLSVGNSWWIRVYDNSYRDNSYRVFQVHKYIIQALVLRDSWPLSRESWDFVLAQRNAEKPDPPDCK